MRWYAKKIWLNFIIACIIKKLFFCTKNSKKLILMDLGRTSIRKNDQKTLKFSWPKKNWGNASESYYGSWMIVLVNSAVVQALKPIKKRGIKNRKNRCIWAEKIGYLLYISMNFCIYTSLLLILLIGILYFKKGCIGKL